MPDPSEIERDAPASPIPLMVKLISAESLAVTGFADPEPRVLRGNVTVTFGNGRDSVDVDWTHRGSPPPIGSQWLLAPVPSGDAGASSASREGSGKS
jgi:hypothetical protein